MKEIISEIQAELLKDKEYKKLVRINNGLDEKLSVIEAYFQNNFSTELTEFLNWSCVMPFWGQPYVAFTNGEQFEIWSNRAKIIRIYLDKQKKAGQKPQLNIFSGKFKRNDQEWNFAIVIDVDGHFFEPESVFIEYAQQKPDYSSEYLDPEKLERKKLFQNITEFAEDLLRQVRK